MKKLVILLLLVGGGLYLWQTGVFEPKAVKVYRAYREKTVARQEGIKTGKPSASTRWSLKINSCKIEDSIADISATERVARIPLNAASFVFATIITTEFKAKLRLKDDKWIVFKEQSLSRDISTYEQRKRSNQRLQ
ncbi:MAG: hypothetical protein GY853_04790 [PVC group bacterium]|nr:hypothetical protein [PVC group bacterium]